MRVQLNATIRWQTAFLEVVIPPDIVYEETSGDMMVPEGSSAKLICKARGFPKPKIIWRREDGREIIARGGPQGKTKGAHTCSPMQLLSIVIPFVLFVSSIKRGRRTAVAVQGYALRDGRLSVHRLEWRSAIG